MPTPMESENIITTPFNLQYRIDSEQSPSEDDLATVQALTQRFIEEIFFLTYDFDQETILDSLDLELVTSVDENGVVSIDYETTATFSEDSVVIPTQEEIDMKVDEAFQMINRDVYLDLLQNTDESNAFSSTEVVDKEDGFRNEESMSMMESEEAMVTESVRRERITGKKIIGVIGAGALVLIGAAVMYYESRAQKATRADRLRKISLTI